MSEEKKPYKIEGRPPTIYRVVKNPENPYVSIDRRPIDNPKMSFKAKGILTYLMSRPDGWEVSVTDLVKHSADGEASIRSGLKELKDFGHMKYTKLREKGRITGWLIEVYEVPHLSSPDSDFQDVEKPDVENRGQVLSTSSINDLNIKNTGATPVPVKMAKPPKPQTPPEIKLFREVVGRYPNKVNYSDITAIIQSVSKRLQRDCTADDLLIYYKAWTSNGWNPFNLAWLGYAERGEVPTAQKKLQIKNSGADALMEYAQKIGAV